MFKLILLILITLTLGANQNGGCTDEQIAAWRAKQTAKALGSLTPSSESTVLPPTVLVDVLTGVGRSVCVSVAVCVGVQVSVGVCV